MKKELLQNTIIIAIGKLSTQILSYLLLPFYTSFLTTAEYGIYDFIVTLCLFILPVVTLSMDESMFRFLVDAKDEKDKSVILSNTTAFVILSTLFWGLVAYVVMSLINYEYKSLVCIYTASCVLINLANGCVRGLGKFKLYTIQNIILSLATMILNILFIAKFKLGMNGLIYSTVIANVVATLFIIIKLKLYKNVKKSYLDKSLLIKMINYSYPLVPNTVSWLVINLSDRLIVTEILGVSANGIYAVANKFPSILNTIARYFFTAFKENASKAIKETDYKSYYSEMHILCHSAFIGISLMLISVMPFVFNIFIKKDFVDAYNYIPILIIALYYGNMSGFYGTLFVAFKESKVVGKSTIIGAISNIIVHLALIKFVGIYAAAISTLVANFVVTVLRRNKIKDYVELKDIDNYIPSLIILYAVGSLYYLKNIYVNIILLLVSTLYSVYINKTTITDFLKLIKRKVKRHA